MNTELSAEIRFRCPCCQKLFCTEATAFEKSSSDVRSERQTAVEFTCSECQKDFNLFNRIDETGLYISEPVRVSKLAHCPKCQQLKPQEADECPQCGVFESKYIEIQKVENPRLYELNKLWQQVVADFSNDQLHQRFMDLAQTQLALNFAAQKYNDIKKIIGQDFLVEKYLKQVEKRLEAQVQSKLIQARLESQKQSFVDHGQQQKLFITVALIGTFILIFNRIKPMFANLNGMVVAITVLSYGLWFFAKTTQDKRH